MTDDCPVVETKLGEVKGRTLQKQSNGKQVYLYTNLPFAKPPLGDLRFEPPCKPEPWAGIRDGGKNPPQPQQDLNMTKMLERFWITNTDLDPKEEDGVDEDCLYLRIFTTNPSKSANLPVLFWMYGGGFLSGAQNGYNGQVLSGLHDVVVVVPNYRVGILGFLTMGKETNYPGNMGLLDQVMALEWTKEHVRNFGGNPNNVTIFGESAGSMSVCFHMLSPLSRGLFHRAIAHSGTISSQGYPLGDNGPALSAFQEALNIKDNGHDDTVARLKSIPAEELIKVEAGVMMKGVYFTPSIDGTFLLDVPKNLLKEGKMAPVPFIVGCNSTEYCGIMSMGRPEGFAEGISEETFSMAIKLNLEYMTGMKVSDTVVDRIKKQYPSKVRNNDKLKWSKLYGEVLGDRMFVFPSIETANYHAKFNHPTFFYNMTQSLRCFHDLEHGQQDMMKASFCECDHGEDIYFTFGLPLDEGRLSLDVKFTDKEKQISKQWMAYLVNFAKTGNPNTGSQVFVEWPLYSLDEQTFLSVQQPCTIKKKLAADRFKFWMEVIEPMIEES